MRFEKTVKNVVPIVEKGTVIWTSGVGRWPDCRWRLVDQKVTVDDSTGSVTIDALPSEYDRRDGSTKVFGSRQEAELYCAVAGLETLASLIDRTCGV